MVHLNELHAKYKDRGLVVLGVTNEASGTVEGFVEDKGAEYPIVIESTDSIRAFQSGSYPTIVLIGPDGRILSTANPSEQAIEAALEGVRMLPDFPKSFAAVRKAMKKDDYAGALGKLEQLSRFAVGQRGSGLVEHDDARFGTERLGDLYDLLHSDP